MLCGDFFAAAGGEADNLAKETFVKLGDISRLMSLYARRQMWPEAAALAVSACCARRASLTSPHAGEARGKVRRVRVPSIC